MEIKRIKQAKRKRERHPQEKRGGTQAPCTSNDSQNRERQIDRREAKAPLGAVWGVAENGIPAALPWRRMGTTHHH